MDTMDILPMATATMGRGLPMRSPLRKLMPNPGGMETMDTTAILPMAMATMERDLLMPSLLQMLMPNPGGMDITDILHTAMATTGRGLQMLSLLQMLMPNPGGMETMDTTAILPMAMATMERGLLVRSQQLMLRPNPGGTDITDILLTAMATMERDLLMPSLLQMPSLGGTEAMDMAGPTVSIGANLTNNRNYWQDIPQNNTHQTDPKWVIAESKKLITKKIKITILALSYCYAVSSPRLCSFTYFTI